MDEKMGEGMTAIPVKPNEKIVYSCNRCGSCCRHIKATVMLEPHDIFKLAKHLQEQEKLGAKDALHMLLNQYASDERLPGSNFPIYTLQTVQDDETCIFLKDGACSVYAARPRTCRIYPFSIEQGERGRDFLYLLCVDRHAHHFKGEHVVVKDLLYENFKREEKDFLLEEWANIERLAVIFKAGGISGPQVNALRELRYWAYDLDKPFLPQYRDNHARLFQKLEVGNT